MLATATTPCLGCNSEWSGQVATSTASSHVNLRPLPRFSHRLLFCTSAVQRLQLSLPPARRVSAPLHTLRWVRQYNTHMRAPVCAHVLCIRAASWRADLCWLCPARAAIMIPCLPSRYYREMRGQPTTVLKAQELVCTRMSVPWLGRIGVADLNPLFGVLTSSRLCAAHGNVHNFSALTSLGVNQPLILQPRTSSARCCP
jgi:hypothetical protein